MLNQEIIKKLNTNNNFHLSLKVIQITDDKLLDETSNFLKSKNKTSIVINSLNNCYELLLEAYNRKIDYVLCNETINFLLPLATILTKEELSIIKPVVPVYYILKDNKIIQNIKTKSRKKMTTFENVNDTNGLFKKIEMLIK